MSDMFFMVFGMIGFCAMIAAIIFIGRVVAGVIDRHMARAMAPLAQTIGGAVDPRGPAIRANYEGRTLRAFNDASANVGSGESASTMNAFYVEVSDLPGVRNWSIKFYVTGLLGQGPKKLYIETIDEAFGERLLRSGIIDEVAAFCTPTTDYVAVAYDMRRKTVTLTTDILREKLPSPKNFVRQAALAVRLAQVNEHANVQT
jgi:hypothetical protein